MGDIRVRTKRGREREMCSTSEICIKEDFGRLLNQTIATGGALYTQSATVDRQG